MCMCVYAYVNIICISCIWEDFSTCRNIKIEVILVLNFSLSANNKHKIIKEKKNENNRKFTRKKREKKLKHLIVFLIINSRFYGGTLDID